MKPSAELEKGGLGWRSGRRQSQTLSGDSGHHVDAKNVSENLKYTKYRHWQQVKRMIQYLAGIRYRVQKIEVNNEVVVGKSIDQHFLVGWSDTDFAGDVESRTRISCAVLRLDEAIDHSRALAQADVDLDEYSRGRDLRNLVGHV